MRELAVTKAARS